MSSMSKLQNLPRLLSRGFPTLAAMLLFAAVEVSAQNYSVLHFFNGDDGSGPWGNLVSSGTALYGTTRYHSTYKGTVFKLNINDGGYTVLHTFQGVDGSDPTAGVVQSGSTLFGTTSVGGALVDPGTLFKINTDGSSFALLREFGGSDGRWPYSGMILSGTTLYGTTAVGGSAGHGTVFKINTDGSGYTVLHSFAGRPSDGRWPDGCLLLSGTTLYGTTPAGGGYGSPEGYGTLFKIETNGTGYTLLKQFTGSDGNWAPGGGFVLLGDTLYGTTEGGYSPDGSYSGGTVFKLKTDGSGYTVLHNFAGFPNDGAVPYGGLVSFGNILYGTTIQGGSLGYFPASCDYGYGTVFKIGTDGTGYSLLKEFSGDDGCCPRAGLLWHGATLYGTASSGGISNNGVVFSLSFPPVLQGAPRTQTAETGSAVGFGAQASGPLLFYLWYFNYTNLISLGTNGWLELTDVQFSQSGAYTAVVTNAAGAVTSSPAMLQVVAPVERRPVPGVKIMGQPGTSWDVVCADSPSLASVWTRLDSVSLSSTPPYYFDLTQPLPPQRFYRAQETADPFLPPVLDLHMIPAITVTGNIGNSVRVDCINRLGPIDAWVTLDTLTLTNTSQLYFDVSAPGQPERLYRLLPKP